MNETVKWGWLELGGIIFVDWEGERNEGDIWKKTYKKMAWILIKE